VIGPSPRAWGQPVATMFGLQLLRSIPTGVGTTFECSTHSLRWSGPSPRAWGQLVISARQEKVGRSIPTGVGTTPLRVEATPLLPVHPHGRGDNDRLAKLGQAHVRSIPTGVGTTSGPRRTGRSTTVHPHGRGDNSCGGSVVDSSYGPSPRAWGQLRFSGPFPDTRRSIPTGVGTTASARRARGMLRSIPTGVGTTTLTSLDLELRTVHPHGRGDNRRPEGLPHSASGPSPRAWGQLCRSGSFLPAKVHPHGRGDNCVTEALSRPVCGPSPRAWGQRGRPAALCLCRRSIPTGVGTTTFQTSPCVPLPVHPHGRGDNIKQAHRYLPEETDLFI